MSEATRSASSDDATSEIRALLADTVGRLFGEEVTRERIVAAESGEWLTGLWEAVEAAGLLRAHLPESAGGAGAGWREAFVVAHAAGRHCVPLPVAETLLAGWLLTRAGLAVPASPLAVAPRPLPSTALRSGRIERPSAAFPGDGMLRTRSSSCRRGRESRSRSSRSEAPRCAPAGTSRSSLATISASR